MSDVLPAAENPAAVAALAAAAAAAKEGLASNTRRAYRAGWAAWAAYCDRMKWVPLPAQPAHVGAFLRSMGGECRTATILIRLAAIAKMHRYEGHVFDRKHPAISEVMRAVEREFGEPQRQVKAICTPEITELVGTCDASPGGVRDRALILLGFAGALRRSELVAIRAEHITIDDDGIRLLIPRSKGDQRGRGETIGIPRGANPDTCPVRALQTWLALLGAERGPVFRRLSKGGRIMGAKPLSGEAVSMILNKRGDKIGMERMSAHGLRAGFVTVAYRAGARDDDIMAHTRHADTKTMRRYIRRSGVVSESPAGKLGL